MTLNIAHRGFSGRYPENTMLAFEKALEAGADGIELDVQLTGDGQLVILHDERLDRTTDGSGLVKDFTYEELSKLDACGEFKGKFEKQRLPLLREYFEWVKDTGLITNIELKNGLYYYSGMEKMVCGMAKEYGLEDRIIISSFNPASIVLCKQFAPHIKMGFLCERPIGNAEAFIRDCGVDYMHSEVHYTPDSLILSCKAAGIGANLWTVNEEDQMDRLLALDINGIITNYPDVLAAKKKQM